LVHLGHDEEAVEFARAEGGVGDGEDEDDLVGIGDQHLLAVGVQRAILRRHARARQGRRRSSTDCTVACAVALISIVTRSPTATMAAFLPRLLQPPADAADDRLPAVVGLDGEEAALGFDDEAFHKVPGSRFQGPGKIARPLAPGTWNLLN
jgi:hypothetical protein